MSRRSLIAASIAPALAALAIGSALIVSGCAILGGGSSEVPPPPATSVQKLSYYEYLVKGYQNSYPHRSVMVLMPVDDRDYSQAGTSDHAPLDGKPAIGISLNRRSQIVQRLYSDPLPPILQHAIALSAEEAGLSAMLGTSSEYTSGQTVPADYVIASTITRGWVIKRRGQNGEYGPMWSTAADFALSVIVYKPPYSVPFWRGTTDSLYNDPPIGSFGLGPEDEAGIYDNPGEVLSVALTRAVAGIFQHEDFRTLVTEDQTHSR